jgi:hypothetical protein
MKLANCAILPRNYYDCLGEALCAHTKTLRNLAVISGLNEFGSFEHDILGINSTMNLRGFDNLRNLMIPLTAISSPSAPAFNVPRNLTQLAMTAENPIRHDAICDQLPQLHTLSWLVCPSWIDHDWKAEETKACADKNITLNVKPVVWGDEDDMPEIPTWHLSGFIRFWKDTCQERH